MFLLFRKTKGDGFVLLNEVVGCQFPACLLMVIETGSLLLMVSIAVDKALALAKPLHYSDIVTFFSVNIYVTIIFIISLVVGVILPLTVFNTELSHAFSVSYKCFQQLTFLDNVKKLCIQM